MKAMTTNNQITVTFLWKIDYFLKEKKTAAAFSPMNKITCKEGLIQRKIERKKRENTLD